MKRERESAPYGWSWAERGPRWQSRVTWWHDFHDDSRLVSSVAVRVGNPSYSYHPEGF